MLALNSLLWHTCVHPCTKLVAKSSVPTDDLLHQSVLRRSLSMYSVVASHHFCRPRALWTVQAGSTRAAAILAGDVPAWSQPDFCRPPAAAAVPAALPSSAAASAAAVQDAQQLQRVDGVAWATGLAFHAGHRAAATAAATLNGSTSTSREASSHAGDGRHLRVSGCSWRSGYYIIACRSVRFAAGFICISAASAATTAPVAAASAAADTGAAS